MVQGSHGYLKKTQLRDVTDGYEMLTTDIWWSWLREVVHGYSVSGVFFQMLQSDYMYVQTCTYVSICIRICLYVYRYMYMYARTYVCIYIIPGEKNRRYGNWLPASSGLTPRNAEEMTYQHNGGMAYKH